METLCPVSAHREMFGVVGRGIALLAMVSALMLVWTGVSLSLRRFGAWRKRRAAPNKLSPEGMVPPSERIRV